MLDLVSGFGFGAVGWGIGFACGFFLELRAHQQERQQWMNFYDAGTFERPQARSHTPDTPESRIDRASKVVSDWSEDSVDKGMAELRQMYRDENLPVPTDKELRREAEMMLNAAVQGDGGIDA